MSKSNKYGYVGVDIPEQSFGNNKGVFNPAEINELVADNKWTQFGQLELISTTTISSAVATVDIQNIKEDIYNVHLLIFSGLNGVSNATEEVMLQMYENGTLETGNVYQFARTRVRSSGTFNDSKSTGYSAIRFSNWDYWDNDGSTGAYMYVYNAGDSTKYTFTTNHNTGFDSEYGGSGTYTSQFGSGVLPQASVVDGFRLKTLFGTNIGSGSISLYGIREFS
jgi:hypothetical protein